MAQIKIYALNKTIKRHRDHLSIAIHQALTKTLTYPIEKKFQRFISLESEHFIYPSDRTESYIIIEISMFEGRTKEAKKALINTLFQNIHDLCGIDFNDIEITIFETPKEKLGN